MSPDGTKPKWLKCSLLRRCWGTSGHQTRSNPGSASNPGANDLDVQIPDLLAQRVAIDAEQVGGANLIPAGCGECCRQERVFHLAQNAMVKPGRRQVIVKAREVTRQVAFD